LLFSDQTRDKLNAAIDREGQMAGERAITVNLDTDTTMVVVAEQIGPALVADEDVVAKLGKVTDSIERVSREVLDALKRVAPTTATVELGFSLAIEAGQLVALFGKGKGEASINVTLEWSKAVEPSSAT
jgi:NTP-dependent ternary system trypsin peptidase co-occuring protein